MRCCSTSSGSSRCSTCGCGSARGRARRSRCRSCAARWRCSTRWRASTRPASPMRGASRLVAAIAFLTRIPVGGIYDVAGGAAVFPLVGAALGAAVGGAAYGLARIMPSLAAAGIALALGALLTGALHLDGLADTADALGARSREGALAIMRDHAIGTYGATALVLDLVVKTAALAALAGRSRVVLEALAAGALSRATPVVLGFALPSVRTQGAGAVFRVGRVDAGVAVVLAAALAVPADLLATRVGLEALVEPDLRELDFGELEGLTVAEAADRYPIESGWMLAPGDAVFPGGESVAELRARAIGVARTIAERHADATVAVFTHAVTIRAILADALTMPPAAMFRLDQSYGGISIVEWFEGNPFVRVVNAARL